MQYLKLAQLYEKLESTTKRLHKTHILSQFLKKISSEDIDMILLLLKGNVFPPWDERKIGVAAKIVLKALHTSTGISLSEIENLWKEKGDLGEVAEDIVSRKKQVTLFSQEITVKKVFDNLRKLPDISGEGTVDKRVQLIAELLTSAKELEAKYIVRTVLEDLRVGLGEGTVRDSIVWAFFDEKIGLKYDKEKNNLILPDDDREKYASYSELVQEAYNAANDFALVARTAKEKGEEGLRSINFEIGKPIKVMLAQKVQDIEQGFERVGKPAVLEYKYDGFRMQIHRKGDEILVFTRRLENVTKQFPDVVAYIRDNTNSDNFILDSEAVGYEPKTMRYLPFQNVSQRIKRKYDIEKTAAQFPVELNVFDVVYFEGENVIKKPFKERRAIIEKIVKEEKGKIVLSKMLITEDVQEADKFYQESLSAGEEGIMLKKIDAFYKPGSRVGFMVKLKPTMRELDLVIVGAEWGEGKRSSWLSSFTLACRDEDTGEFLEIGKVGTGIKEKEEEGFTFNQLTELLKPHIKSEKGKEVKIKPVVVIEVTYEEIQRSPSYSSGYALRFPRFLRIRDDRAPEECSSLDMVDDFYEEQRGRM